MVEVRVSGPGSGRESAVRALSTAGIEVRAIRDVTPIPHNGAVRPRSAECKCYDATGDHDIEARLVTEIV